MTKVEEIRNILNGLETHDKNNAVENIVSKISVNAATDEQIIAYIEKKAIDFEVMKEYARNQVKKANRVKHSFKTMNELNDFTAKNNCGDFWFDYDTEEYHVYKY